MAFNTLIDQLKKADSTTLFITLLIVVIIILVVYNMVKISQINATVYQNVRNNDNVENLEIKKSNKFVLYFSHNCGHCVQMLPEWEKLKATIGDYKMNITLEQYDCESSPVCNANNINAYPTMILYKSNGEKVNYPDSYQRTAVSMVSFIRESI